MNPKDMQKKGQQFFKKNRKTIAKVMHHVPAPPLIHLFFDVTLPRMVQKKEYQNFKGQKTNLQFTFSEMPGRKSWVIDIDDGKVRIYRGEKDFPAMIINSSARDFIDLTTGYLSEATAMKEGSVGDRATLAHLLPSCLDWG